MDATIGGMVQRIRAMPGGIRLLLVYAALILAGIGLSLRFVVDEAIAAPISPLGVLVMVLLAYTIFTTTLVLQRKQAARGLALGLASLIIPAIVILATSPGPSGHAVLRGGVRGAPVPWAAAARGAHLPERAVGIRAHRFAPNRYPHADAALVAAGRQHARRPIDRTEAPPT